MAAQVAVLVTWTKLCESGEVHPPIFHSLHLVVVGILLRNDIHLCQNHYIIENLGKLLIACMLFLAVRSGYARFELITQLLHIEPNVQLPLLIR